MKIKRSMLAICYIIVIITLLISCFPLLQLVLTSLKTESQIFNIRQIFPTSITFANYYRVVFKANFFMYFMNSVFVAFFTTAICIVLAAMAAYGFCRFNIVGSRHLRMGILYVRMFPGILLSVPYYIIMRKLGLANTLTGLILIYCSFSLPFCIWYLRAFFMSLPWEIEESAFIDGAGRAKAFLLIVLPMARPGILSTSLLAFITSWEEFMFANLFITSTSKKTVQLGVRSFIGEYSTDWGGMMAAAMISLIPVIAFFALVQKNLVSGITAGAVKG